MTTFDYEANEALFLEHVSRVKCTAMELAGDLSFDHPETYDQFEHWLSYGWNPYRHTNYSLEDLWNDLWLDLDKQEVEPSGYFSDEVDHLFDYEGFYRENVSLCDREYRELYGSDERADFTPGEAMEYAAAAALYHLALGDLVALKQIVEGFDTDLL